MQTAELVNVAVERSGRVATVSINRPTVLNALDGGTLTELDRVFAGLARDESVAAVVLTGVGKAFVAGADIRELAAQDPNGATEYSRRGQLVMNRIEGLGKPVVAAVNGFALGGGCELALACTFRIAAESAQLGLPEITLGLIPGFGGTQRLPRLVGKSIALDLMLSGRRVAAPEALQIGLVNRVVPGDTLLQAAHEQAAMLAAQAPIAARLILDAVNQGLEVPLEAGQQIERALFGVAAGTEDMREGTKAFLEKRKANFAGR